MSDIGYYCPSYKRSGSVDTLNIIPDLILCVAESEKADYQAAYPSNEIMAIPDAVEGNMARVRNWILDHATHKYVVMMDDDIAEFGYFFGADGRSPLTTEGVRAVIENGFQMCEELGTILWGVNQNEDPQVFRAYSPISLVSPVLGPFVGIIRGDKTIRYDERLGLKEDYDFFIQVARKYRKALRINMYYYFADHQKKRGGCVSFRISDRERTNMETLQRKWGTDIVKARPNNVNPIISLPIPGI